MPVVINGSTGISGTDGSASTPAVQGTDTNTGMFFPAADTIAFAEAGTEVMRLDASGNVGIGTASPSARLDVSAATYCAVQVNSGAIQGQIAANGGGTVDVRAVSNHPLLLYTNNVERMRLDTSGNLLFNSGYGSVATAYGCRSWVNFNGTGTVAIRASGNVSSITDNAASDYTVNFTTAMPDANYCVTALSSTDGGNQAVSFQVFPSGAVPTTSSVRLKNYTTNTGQVDSAYCYVAIFR